MNLDTISEARLALVYPGLTDKAHQMAEMLSTETIVIRVTQGLRSWAQQAAIFAQGRTAPGEIVTEAPPGYSYHEFGCAFDVVPMVNGEPDWNLTHPSWPRIIAIGESLGLNAGARWHKPDTPHFEMTGRFPLNVPDDEARQILQNEGVEAFWGEAFQGGVNA